MALHALELKDGGGPDGTLLVSFGGIERHGLEAGQLGGTGIGLLPRSAHTQDDDVLGQVLREGLLGQDRVEQLMLPARRVLGADRRRTMDTRRLIEIGSYC